MDVYLGILVRDPPIHVHGLPIVCEPLATRLDLSLYLLAKAEKEQTETFDTYTVASYHAPLECLYIVTDTLRTVDSRC